MRPTTLSPGDFVRMDGKRNILKFVRREFRNSSSGALNIFICEEWEGLNGPDDKGECVISDYDVSRKCSRV